MINRFTTGVFSFSFRLLELRYVRLDGFEIAESCLKCGSGRSREEIEILKRGLVMRFEKKVQYNDTAA
jgi:hypothetical protein